MRINEARRRQFIEDSFGQAEAFLRDEPMVADALGPLALELADICPRLYIPEVHEQTLILPAEALASEALPVVALTPGEHVRIPQGAMGMTPQQQEVAYAATQALQPTGLVTSALVGRAHEEMLTVSEVFEGRHTAQTKWVRSVWTNGERDFASSQAPEVYGFMGRPFLSLRYDGSGRPASLALMGHELRHIKQAAEQLSPAHTSDDVAGKRRLKTEHELESYQVGGEIAQVMQRLDLSLNGEDDDQLEIFEGVTLLGPPDKPFTFPSPERMQYLRSKGYDV